MSIDGQTSQPFSAMTLKMPEPPDPKIEEILQHSRSHYSSARADVEKNIAEWSGLSEEPPKDQGAGGQQDRGQAAPPREPDVQKPNIHGVEPKKYSAMINKNQGGQRQGGGRRDDNRGGGDRNRNRNQNRNRDSRNDNRNRDRRR
jgi:hypothetical protein